MPGLLSGVSDLLFGSAPGASFDPETYIARMQAMDSQIQALYSNAPQSNVLGSSAFTDIRSLLGPNANGSLSMPLLAQYGAGSQTNALNTSRAEAEAMSGAQARNLSGSSMEQQGVENARFGGQMADSSLLAALYGLQNQNTGSLASLLSGGAMFDQSQNQNLLNSHAAALAGIGGGYGNLAGMGMNQNYQSRLAGYENAGNLGNSLLSAGLIYGLMPSAPAAGAGTQIPGGGAGLSSMGGGLDLPGSGYGAFGMARMGAGGYAGF